MSEWMARVPGPGVIDDAEAVDVYARADFTAVNRAFLGRLADLVEAWEEGRSDGRVVALDLGTGPGTIAMQVARLRPRWTVIGLDASEAMLALASYEARTKRPDVRPRFVLGNVTRTPLPGRSVHVVFGNSILHRMDDPDLLWKEVSRLARPGGLAFFRDLARPRDPADARAVVEQHAKDEPAWLREEYYRSLLASFTPPEVRRQLASAKLDLYVEMSSDRHLDVFGRM